MSDFKILYKYYLNIQKNDFLSEKNKNYHSEHIRNTLINQNKMWNKPYLFWALEEKQIQLAKMMRKVMSNKNNK